MAASLCYVAARPRFWDSDCIGMCLAVSLPNPVDARIAVALAPTALWPFAVTLERHMLCQTVCAAIQRVESKLYLPWTSLTGMSGRLSQPVSFEALRTAALAGSCWSLGLPWPPRFVMRKGYSLRHPVGSVAFCWKRLK